MQSSILSDALREDQKKSLDVLNAVETNLTNKEYAQRKLEDIENEIKKQSFGNAALDIAADFIPFLKNYRMTNLLKGAASPLLPGTNRQDQYTQYYLGNPKVSAELLDKAVDDLKSKNLHQAKDYLEGLLQFTSSSQFLSNASQALDASVLPVGSAVRRLASGSMDVLRSASSRAPRTSGVLEGMGDLNNASLASVLERVDSLAIGTTNRLDSWAALKQDSMALVNPRALTENGSSVLSREQTQRLVADLENNSASLLNKVINETLPIGRVLDNPGAMNDSLR